MKCATPSRWSVPAFRCRDRRFRHRDRRFRRTRNSVMFSPESLVTIGRNRWSRCPGIPTDEGIDLRLRKDGETYLVQCKQWRAFKVGVPVVRELYGVMAAKGAAGGFVVTSGRFTAEAEAFAEGRNVRLLDGPKLERMLKQARGVVSTPRTAAAPVPSAAGGVQKNASPLSPICPKCSQQMKRRQATKGARAGQDFWGCVTYPHCRGTRAVEANA